MNSYQIKPWMIVTFYNCTAIDDSGERKPALLVHRSGPLMDLPMFDSDRTSVVFGGEMPQSVEEADRLLDAEDDDPEILGTVILEDD